MTLENDQSQVIIKHNDKAHFVFLNEKPYVIKNTIRISKQMPIKLST